MIKPSSHGFSLLSVVIALGLLGIITAVVSEMIRSSSVSQQSLELQMDQSAIRRLVLTSTDCSKTVTGGPFSIDEFLKLVKPTGTTLVAKYTDDGSATKFGKMLVRSVIRQCSSCANGKGIFIEAKLAGIGQYSAKFSNWSDINKGVTLPCVIP